MKVIATLTDANGDKGTRIENLRWFLNLISAYIKGGAEITVLAAGGQITVRRRV